MTIKQIPESHVDHSLTLAQLEWALAQEAPSGEVAVQTLRLPFDLGIVPCGLYGPVMGDTAVPEGDVFYAIRGERKGVSRLMRAGAARQTRKITIISGPHGDTGDDCVLYTAFGGPSAPREVYEDDSEESREFWAEHALAVDHD